MHQDAGTLSWGEKIKLAPSLVVGGRHNLLRFDERQPPRSAVDTDFVRDLQLSRALLMPDGDLDEGPTSSSIWSSWSEPSVLAIGGRRRGVNKAVGGLDLRDRRMRPGASTRTIGPQDHSRNTPARSNRSTKSEGARHGFQP